MTSVPTIPIWIYRKGNGMFKVHPCPAEIRQQGTVLRFVNLTDCAIRLSSKTPLFGGEVYPLGAKLGDELQFVDVRLHLDKVSDKHYYEYQVEIDCDKCGHFYAEGGSDPGVIIDI